MSDVSAILIWWLTIFVIGGIFTPITFSIFRRFIDKGYIFSKIIGILFSSYLIWLLGSFHILPFSKMTIIVVLVGFTLLNLFLRNKNSQTKIPWRAIILEESLFLLTLSCWSYIRANEPSIHSLEKYMDFGFVNSILRTSYFPPLDMWLTKSPDYTGGYFINYYYYGHYINAYLTKIAGIDSAVTYNLMIATLFAFTFTLPFSIGMNLYYFLRLHLWENLKLKLKHLKNVQEMPLNFRDNLKLLLVGLLAAFVVSLGGNLHTIYVFTNGYPNEDPVPFWKIEAGYHPEKYWYPNATRFIPFTIHEFPIYSFVVADLHGHVSDIPMVFLIIALLLTIVIEERKEKRPENISPAPSKLSSFIADFENHTSISFYKIGLLGILLAVMYMTNAWDGLIYMVLCGMVFLYVNYRRKKTDQQVSSFAVLYKTFSASLFLLFFFLVANLPFSLNFKPFVSGLGVLCAPKFLADKKIGPLLFEADHCQRSPLYMMALLWGFFYFNVLGFLTLVIWPRIGSFRPLREFKNKLSSLINLNPIDIFVCLLIFISTLLLIFPEFFYIKDIYPAHYRANTMFKLGYQAFMMLGIASAYIFFRIRAEKEDKGGKIGFILYTFCFLLLFTLVAIYPQFAINSYYGNLQKYYGLNGVSWMTSQYPDDYNAIMWLNKNINCEGTDCNKQPVIVEANGDSYTDFDRVSAYTGLPTIVGWPVHEWLWRGSYDEAGKRIPEVAAIYESKDMENTKEILRKYNVEYIFLGTLERQKYPALDEEKLLKLGKVVFESGTTKIIKVSSNYTL